MEHQTEADLQRDMLLTKWERRAEWPLAGVAVAFLIAYAWPILDPSLHPDAAAACRAVVLAAWIVFAVDYVARLLLAERRLHFVRQNLLDLAVIALPLLRPLRLLRLMALLRVLNRSASTGLRGRVAIYVSGAIALIVLVGGLAILDAERVNPEANITTPADAWWWAATTVSTVGYGDRYPTTATGRRVAVALMICGIALLGAVTATLASWLVERIKVEETETRSDIAELAEEIRQLRAEVHRLTVPPLPPSELSVSDFWATTPLVALTSSLTRRGHGVERDREAQ